MHTVYIALGTNLADRRANLQAAMDALPPTVKVLQASSLYQTAPWGLADQPAFLNMVLRGETRLSPAQLLNFLKRLEVKLGRLPSVRWGPRLIDMDILFYDDRVIHTPRLAIPHPRLHERGFVLVPLADIAPDFVHPVLKKTIRDLMASVDREGVSLYEPAP